MFWTYMFFIVNTGKPNSHILLQARQFLPPLRADKNDGQNGHL